MDLRRDDRGQAIQVGAVLLFAMLVIAMSVYQAQVVPQENAQIEFDSYLDASSDMTKLRNDILGVAATNDPRGVTVTTGTNYPARVFFVNPGPATGRIRTGPAETLSLTNVKSTSSHQNVDTYLQSESSNLTYTTRDVEFDPSYNEISDQIAPVVIANGLTYRNYSSPIPLTTQTIIQGNRLTFVTVAGDLDAGGITTPITTDPISAHTRTITVTNRTTNPLVITIPTPISAATWESDILAGQMDPAGTIAGQYVMDVAPGPRPNTVNVTLEPGANYELRLGRVELHEKSDAREADSPEARYLVAETDQSVTTTKGRIKLTVEARDKYNNAVSNTVVNFSGPGYDFETQDGSDLSMPVKTDENGQATVWYNATGIVGNLPVTANLSESPPAADEKDVQFTVTNTFTGGGAGGGVDSNINPGNFIVLEDATLTGKFVEVTINNTGTSTANMTAMRFSFFFQETAVERTKVYNATTNTELVELEKFGPFTEIPGTPTIQAKSTYSFDFEFFTGPDDNKDTYSPNANQDFFVVEIVFDDAYVATFFVSFE